MLKILGFDTGGYWIWSKRLEQGQFALGRGAKELKRELNRTALLALVEGVDIKILRQRKRYRKVCLNDSRVDRFTSCAKQERA